MIRLTFWQSPHGDSDHAGEAVNILNNISVSNVLINNDSLNSLEVSVINELDNFNIPYYQNVKEIDLSTTKLYFLNDLLYDNENDNSLVTYTNFGGIEFLFMGDAGIDVELDLLEKYDLENIDVLKVGHHGSKSSSSAEFINVLNPGYSVISVGKNNRYNHPNSEVLKILNDTTVYRTDYDGTIVFKMGSDKFNIEMFMP